MTLADTLYRQPRREGWQPIQRRGTGARELTTLRLRLSAGSRAPLTMPDEESVLVLHRGSGTFACAGHTWDVSRANVFTESATALLVPPGEELVVTATTDLEAVLVATPAPPGGVPVLRTPADIPVQHRGKPGYERDVRELFVGDAHARRIVVGETSTLRYSAGRP